MIVEARYSLEMAHEKRRKRENTITSINNIHPSIHADSMNQSHRDNRCPCQGQLCHTHERSHCGHSSHKLA